MNRSPRARAAQAVTLLGAALALAPPAWGQRVAEESLFASIAGSGARALGMGGAFIAIADDATAASWNPAGLCVLEKAEAALVGQPYASFKTSFAGYRYADTGPITGGTFSTTQREPPLDFKVTSRSFDFASITLPFRIGSVKLVPQISYQRVIDLGPDFEYTSSARSTSSSGSQSGISSVESFSTSESSFSSTGVGKGGVDLIAGSLGISLTPKLYLGVAFNRWFNGSSSSGPSSTAGASGGHTVARSVFGITSTSSTGSSENVTERTLEEDFKGWNFHAGLLFKPITKLSLGLVYKHPFDMTYAYRQTLIRNGNSATTSRSGTSTTTTRTTSTTTTETTRSGEIRWPRTIGGGVAFMPRDFVTFAFDYTSIEWSGAQFTYRQAITRSSESRTVTSRTGFPDVTTSRSTPPSTTSTERLRIWPTYYDPSFPDNSYLPAQNDARQLRFGVEFVVRKPGLLGLVVLPLRAGFAYDRQIFKNTGDLTEVNYRGFTGGLGLVWSRVSLDFAYVFTAGAFNDDYLCPGPTGCPGFSPDVEASFIRDENNSFHSQRLYVSTVVRF